MRIITVIAIGLSFSIAAIADQYHYEDILIGDRAAGLGGAYTAISDDPSGMYYNPAGIVYSTDNYLSLSVNAFASSSETYKNIVPGQDYTYSSSSIVPSFFGFLQSSGKSKYGFFVAVPSSDSIDQNDSLTGLTTIPDQGNSFQRRFFHKDTQYLFGPSYAQEVSHNLSLGFSLPFLIRSENVIDNQFAIYNPPSGGTAQRWFFQESSRSTVAHALVPKFGIQFMPSPEWTLGLTLSYPLNLGGSGKYNAKSLITSSSSYPNGVVAHDLNLDQGNISSPRIPKVFHVSSGLSHFFNRRFLMTGSFDYFGSDNSYNNSAVAAIPYSVKATWNASAGMEYYFADTLAMRIGLFTNRANSSVVQPNLTNQAEHVDQYSGALGFSYFRTGSSISLTGVYGYGKGDGQGLSATTGMQQVIRSNLNILLSGTYQM